MKNIHIVTLLLISFVLVTACSDKSVPKKVETSVGDGVPPDVATEVYDKAPVTDENAPGLQDEEDCHGKRAVIQTLEEADGVIMKVANMFVISMNEGTKRYQPCDLPKKFNKEGVLVRVTGEVLEIFQYERRAASPFRMTNISERDN